MNTTAAERKGGVHKNKQKTYILKNVPASFYSVTIITVHPVTGRRKLIREWPTNRKKCKEQRFDPIPIHLSFLLISGLFFNKDLIPF